jgi:hypothetical protein
VEGRDIHLQVLTVDLAVDLDSGLGLGKPTVSCV